MSATATQSNGRTTIRPFTVEIPEADLEDLRARIAATRFPERETVEDDSQGVPLALMQDLARYWATEYDWRKCEARLNALPNFVTEIDGLDIHFIHVRSKHEDALPLVVCHGWPGSIVEQLKLIGPLTDPTAHGASASDAFHVVIPSMPGYGFSGKPTTTGWDPVHIGKAYVELMKRLGYTRFVAQGGDWGAIVVDAMAGGRADPAAAEPAPPELIGIHTNMPGVIPPDLFTAAFVGSPAPSGLSDEELSTYEQLLSFFATHVAYGLIMGTRPQTLYGLADSPDRSRRVHARPRRRERSARPRPAGPRGASREAERPHARRHPGQHHAVLADQHRGVLGAAVLGEQAPLLRGQGREGPGRREHLRRRDLPGSAELGRAGVPQPRLLQPARQGRALRGLGAAAAALRRRPRDVPIASLRMTVFARVHMPSLGGATEWLNSEPLGPAELRGHVVLVNFAFAFG